MLCVCSDQGRGKQEDVWGLGEGRGGRLVTMGLGERREACDNVVTNSCSSC